jgi:hypothetical protein
MVVVMLVVHILKSGRQSLMLKFKLEALGQIFRGTFSCFLQ